MGPALRRLLLPVVMATGLVLAFPLPGRAATAEGSFRYGVDAANWYWRQQVNQTVGAGPVAQVVILPNPQAPNTLPVAADRGETDKISAISFDLSARGMPAGSTITSLVIRLAEGTGDNTKNSKADSQPEFNTDGRIIDACPITGAWSTGDGAELWDRRPEFAAVGCVKGTRTGPDTAPFWVFDLTPIALAGNWGAAPASVSGVMLVPEIPADAGPQDASWQINLKLPARDDASTADVDEGAATAANATVQSTYTPPGTGGNGSGGNGSGGNGSGGSSYGGGSTGGSSGGGYTGGGTTDFGGGTTTTTTTTTGTGQPPATNGGAQNPAASGAPVGTVPKLPGYVWILIPLGLVALAVARAAVVEPTAQNRPGGVVSAIRSRNAELRGAPGAMSPAERVLPVPLSLGTYLRRGLERAGLVVSDAWKRVRRR